MPAMLGIVAFEANNHYRILIGRLISSNIYTLIFWNLSVQVRFLKQFP
jgi:hypothetical protein